MKRIKLGKFSEIKLFGYRCPECGNDTWLADAPEKYIYCAHCGGDEGKLRVTKILKIRGRCIEEQACVLK
jgi:ribosomal protein S27AE